MLKHSPCPLILKDLEGFPFYVFLRYLGYSSTAICVALPATKMILFQNSKFDFKFKFRISNLIPFFLNFGPWQCFQLFVPTLTGRSDRV